MTTRRKSIATSECTFHDFMFITPLALPMSKDGCRCLCVTCSSSSCSTFLQRKKENLVGQHPRKDTCMGCRCARARTAGISRHSETGYLHWQLTFSSTPLPSVRANLCIVHSTCARGHRIPIDLFVVESLVSEHLRSIWPDQLDIPASSIHVVGLLFLC